VESELNLWQSWLEWNSDPAAMDYYCLLGLPRGEKDLGRVAKACDSLLIRARGIRPGAHRQEWTLLLDTLQNIKRVLTDPQRKAEYDHLLQTQPQAATVAALRNSLLQSRAKSQGQVDSEVRAARSNTSGQTKATQKTDASDVPGAGDSDATIDPAMAPFVPDFQPLVAPTGPAATAPWVAASPQPTNPLAVQPAAQPVPLAASEPLVSSVVPGYTTVGTNPGQILPQAVPGYVVGGSNNPLPGALPMAAAKNPTVTPAAIPVRPRSPRRSAGASMVGKSVLFLTGAAAGLAAILLLLWLTGAINLRSVTSDQRKELAQANDPRSTSPERAVGSSESRTTATSPALGSKNSSIRENVSSDPSGSRDHSGNGVGNMPGLSAKSGSPDAASEPSSGSSNTDSGGTQPPTGNSTSEMPSQPASSTQKSEPAVPPGSPKVPASEPLQDAPLSPAERQTLAESLEKARAALLQMDLEGAAEHLDKARPLARVAEHREWFSRLERLKNYLEQYQQAVQRALQKLSAGDNLEISSDLVIGIVERKPTELTVRIAGRNMTYSLKELPLRLGLALIENGMEAGPQLWAVKAAFQATHPRATEQHKQEAQQWWKQAAEGGEPTEDLERVFTDDYSQHKQPESGSNSPSPQ